MDDSKVTGLRFFFFFFQAEDGIRDYKVTGVQTCALPIYAAAEAEYVAGQLLILQRRDSGARLAVLYRTNFQSRALEEALRRLSLRYLVLGGFSFYQRAEIKDALAYVRLAINPDDDVGLLRVLNTPPRGIGPKAVESLRAMARERGISLWAAVVGTTDSTSTAAQREMPRSLAI